jgi:hypothetical protein
MGIEGIKAIADAIEVNQSLTCMDLYLNIQNRSINTQTSEIERAAELSVQVFQDLVNAMIGNYSLIYMDFTLDVWYKTTRNILEMSKRILTRNKSFVSPDSSGLMKSRRLTNYASQLQLYPLHNILFTFE